MSRVCSEAHSSRSLLSKRDTRGGKSGVSTWDADQYGKGSNTVFQRLPKRLKDKCLTNGSRNSHLLSIAPTGTIALTSDNVRNAPCILDSGCHRPAFCRPPPYAYASVEFQVGTSAPEQHIHFIEQGRYLAATIGRRSPLRIYPYGCNC